MVCRPSGRETRLGPSRLRSDMVRMVLRCRLVVAPWSSSSSPPPPSSSSSSPSDVGCCWFSFVLVVAVFAVVLLVLRCRSCCRRRCCFCCRCCCCCCCCCIRVFIISPTAPEKVSLPRDGTLKQRPPGKEKNAGGWLRRAKPQDADSTYFLPWSGP